jgi:hypothetical protein
MAAGRLTLAEYEERLAHVYETKTLGGLAELTADLPPLHARTPAPAPAASAPARANACGPWGASRDSAWSAWLRTALIVLGIWLVTSLATGALLFFWPIWVIGPWGAVLLARTVTGSRPVGPRNGRDRNGRGRLRA